MKAEKIPNIPGESTVQWDGQLVTEAKSFKEWMYANEEYVRKVDREATAKSRQLYPAKHGQTQEIRDRIAGSLVAARLIGFLEGQNAPQP